MADALVLAVALAGATVHEPSGTPRPPRVVHPADPQPSTPTTPPGGISLAVGLLRATVEAGSLDDDEPERVRVCFTGEVQRVAGARGFLLQGYDTTDIATSTAAEVDEGDRSCVRTAYPVGTDLTRFAIAVVRTAAVSEVSGEVNVQAARPLGGRVAAGGSGRTTGPDLVAVDTDPTLGRVTYRFDERLDAAPLVDPTAFTAVTPSGRVRRGSDLVEVDDASVVVTFDEEDGELAEEGVRFGVAGGAVRDLGGGAGPPGATGQRTAAPELIGAIRVPESLTQWDLRFDQPVQSADPSRLLLYGEDASPYVADLVARPAPDVVRAAFRAVRDFPDQVVLVVALAGAVAANDESARPGVLATHAIGAQSGRRGATSGPDLVGATLDPSTGQATFGFDEAVDDDAAPDPTGFAVVVASGELRRGEALVEVRGREVVIQLPESVVEAAVAVTVGPGAVRDHQGNASPVGTVVTSP